MAILLSLVNFRADEYLVAGNEVFDEVFDEVRYHVNDFITAVNISPCSHSRRHVIEYTPGRMTLNDFNDAGGTCF